MQANHVAMRLGEREGQDIESHRRAAAESAEALSPYPSFVFGRWLRALYYEYVGEMEKAEADHRSTVQTSDARMWKVLCGSFLFMVGKTDEAADMKNSPWLYLGDRDSREEVLKEFSDIMANVAYD